MRSKEQTPALMEIEELETLDFVQDSRWKTFDSKTKENINNNLRTDSGLYSGANNIFAGLALGDIGSVKPVLTYEEYIRKALLSVFDRNQEVVDFVIDHSNKKSAQKLNQLISDFNSELQEIKDKQDVAAIQQVCQRAKQLITGEGVETKFEIWNRQAWAKKNSESK